MSNSYRFSPGAQFIAAGPPNLNLTEPVTVTLDYVEITATHEETSVKLTFTNSISNHQWSFTPQQAVSQLNMNNAIQIK